MRENFRGSAAVMSAVANDQVLLDSLSTIADACRACLQSGNKLLIAGNGGSAADAQHMAAELTGRYKTERKPLAAIALSTDTSALTAIGNDYGFEEVFSRQVEALGRRGDVLIVFSTSGNSQNLVRAVGSAKTLGIAIVALLGRDGGSLANMADIAWIAPSDDTARIQEAHQVALHAICETLEASA